MVSLKTVVLAIVAPILVFVGVSAYLGSLPQLIQKLSEGVAGAKTFFSPIFNAWANLPSSVKNVIMLGIPTLVTLFFAWTKSRAMTKLQQTEQQAATQATQLTGELTQAQATAGSTLQENMNLKSQLAVYEKDGSAVTALKEINSGLTVENSSLKAQINDLTSRYTTLRTDFEALVNRGDPLKKTA